jgi:hypothetical protein
MSILNYQKKVFAEKFNKKNIPPWFDRIEQERNFQYPIQFSKFIIKPSFTTTVVELSSYSNEFIDVDLIKKYTISICKDKKNSTIQVCGLIDENTTIKKYIAMKLINIYYIDSEKLINKCNTYDIEFLQYKLSSNNYPLFFNAHNADRGQLNNFEIVYKIW